MRDDRDLAADYYLPSETTGPWPVILIQTPYNKNLMALAILQPTTFGPMFASQDYAFVVVDWRGFFGSAAAAYQGSPTRGEDGYDAVEWSALQTWSTGEVGTWGPSALGIVQLQTALQSPPSLKACVPQVCHLGDTYHMWYPGGVYYKNRNDFVIEYFFGNNNPFRAHPTYDTFWQVVENLTPSYDGVTTPMLFQSGWYDHETIDTIGEFAQVRAAQGENSKTRLLIGPWSHGNMGEIEQGELSFPEAEFEDFEQALIFFDEHLRGIPPATNPPPLQYFQINDNRWEFDFQWPPAIGIGRRAMFLRDGGGLTSDFPNGDTLGATFSSDPNNPVPTLFGSLLTEDTGTQGPGDLAPLVGRSDTAFFQSAPRTTPLELVGDHRARIWVSSDTPDIDLVLRMVQVTPTGEILMVSDGIKRVSLRNDFSTREFLTSGVPVEVPLDFAPVAITIPVGHRLGILVAASNYDLWEMNPQDGNNFLDDAGAVPRIATVKIWTDPDHPAMLDLAVRDGFIRWGAAIVR